MQKLKNAGINSNDSEHIAKNESIHNTKKNKETKEIRH
jgi:hypothetical protein